MPTGYVVGAFDLLNVRDIDVIAQVRARCDHVVVGVLDDDEVQRLYGRPPVVPLVERLALLEHVRGVDDVMKHHASCAVQDGAHELFAIGAEPVPDDMSASMRVIPRLHSRCEAVRQATAPSPVRAVA